MNQGQQSFSNALLSPESQVPAGLTNGMGKGATRRFSVYRNNVIDSLIKALQTCLLYTSPSPRDVEESRMPSSA